MKNWPDQYVSQDWHALLHRRTLRLKKPRRQRESRVDDQTDEEQGAH
jgi:hypothetical protein